MADTEDELFTVHDDGKVIAAVVGVDTLQADFNEYLDRARDQLEAEDLDIYTDTGNEQAVFTRSGAVVELPDQLPSKPTTHANPAD